MECGMGWLEGGYLVGRGVWGRGKEGLACSGLLGPDTEGELVPVALVLGFRWPLGLRSAP